MEEFTQTLSELIGKLGPLEVDWQDAVSLRVVERIKALPKKAAYTRDDIAGIVEGGPFDDGMLILRLFLGLSKDRFTAVMTNALGSDGSGSTRYKKDKEVFLNALTDVGVLDAMGIEVNKPMHWSDTLVERLRSGRGSAISGQARGRGVEDNVEAVIRKVFGTSYATRVTFSGKPGKVAKCDFAIPGRDTPRIVLEAKGYGATGSKMTDIIGDIEKIIDAKRGNTFFLFFTDGLTWQQRQSDLRKIIAYQNNGDIMRIYTFAMLTEFEDDLRKLKQECGL